MTSTVRLRQICLVAPSLAPVEDDLRFILGLDVSYRDPHVGKYGLENALLPVDDILLEVVSPTRDGTAAGRFIDKTNGQGGYMAIFSCDDPDDMARRANSIGVRTANVIDHPPYHGVQLHPRDCRAAFIEFNHTSGSDNVFGPYPPAGENWHEFIRKDVTTSFADVQMQSPEPHALATHWGAILGLPAAVVNDDRAVIALPNATISFTKGESEIMSGLALKVVDRARILRAAQSRGLAITDASFFLSGVHFHLS